MKNDSSPAVAPGPLPTTGETVTRNSQGPIKDTLELGAKLLFGLAAPAMFWA
jgi:hypothetical protein